MVATTLGEHRGDARAFDDSGQDSGSLQWCAEEAQDVYGEVMTLRSLGKGRISCRDDPDDLCQRPRPEPVSAIVDRHRDGRQAQVLELRDFCAGHSADPVTFHCTGFHRCRELFRDGDDVLVRPGSPGSHHAQECRSASRPRSARMGVTPSPTE